MNGGIGQVEQLAALAATVETIDRITNPYARSDGGPGRRVPANAAFPHINRHKLALACNVTDSCIGKVFNRDTVPGLRLAGRMAKVLGVSIEELLTELGTHKKGKVLKGKGKTKGTRDRKRKRVS